MKFAGFQEREIRIDIFGRKKPETMEQTGKMEIRRILRAPTDLMLRQFQDPAVIP